jgi:hypothetical protein
MIGFSRRTLLKEIGYRGIGLCIMTFPFDEAVREASETLWKQLMNCLFEI